MLHLNGKVWVWKNGILVEKGSNAIDNGLKAYFRDRMTATTPDRAINNLINTYEEAFGGSQDSKDGMLVLDNAGDELTMTTTVISPQGSNARRWRGEIVVSGSPTLVSARLGHNFNSGTSPFFSVPFANRTFASAHDMSPSGTLVIEWEIQVT